MSMIQPIVRKNMVIICTCVYTAQSPKLCILVTKPFPELDFFPSLLTTDPGCRKNNVSQSNDSSLFLFIFIYFFSINILRMLPVHFWTCSEVTNNLEFVALTKKLCDVFHRFCKNVLMLEFQIFPSVFLIFFHEIINIIVIQKKPDVCYFSCLKELKPLPLFLFIFSNHILANLYLLFKHNLVQAIYLISSFLLFPPLSWSSAQNHCNPPFLSFPSWSLLRDNTHFLKNIKPFGVLFKKLYVPWILGQNAYNLYNSICRCSEDTNFYHVTQGYVYHTIGKLGDDTQIWLHLFAHFWLFIREIYFLFSKNGHNWHADSPSGAVDWSTNSVNVRWVLGVFIESCFSEALYPLIKKNQERLYSVLLFLPTRKHHAIQQTAIAPVTAFCVQLDLNLESERRTWGQYTYLTTCTFCMFSIADESRTCGSVASTAGVGGTRSCSPRHIPRSGPEETGVDSSDWLRRSRTQLVRHTKLASRTFDLGPLKIRWKVKFAHSGEDQSHGYYLCTHATPQRKSTDGRPKSSPCSRLDLGRLGPALGPRQPPQLSPEASMSVVSGINRLTARRSSSEETHPSCGRLRVPRALRPTLFYAHNTKAAAAMSILIRCHVYLVTTFCESAFEWLSNDPNLMMGKKNELAIRDSSECSVISYRVCSKMTLKLSFRNDRTVQPQGCARGMSPTTLMHKVSRPKGITSRPSCAQIWLLRQPLLLYQFLYKILQAKRFSSRCARLSPQTNLRSFVHAFSEKKFWRYPFDLKNIPLDLVHHGEREHGSENSKGDYESGIWCGIHRAADDGLDAKELRCGSIGGRGIRSAPQGQNQKNCPSNLIALALAAQSSDPTSTHPIIYLDSRLLLNAWVIGDPLSGLARAAIQQQINPGKIILVLFCRYNHLLFSPPITWLIVAFRAVGRQGLCGELFLTPSFQRGWETLVEKQLSNQSRVLAYCCCCLGGGEMCAQCNCHQRGQISCMDSFQGSSIMRYYHTDVILQKLRHFICWCLENLQICHCVLRKTPADSNGYHDRLMLAILVRQFSLIWWPKTLRLHLFIAFRQLVRFGISMVLRVLKQCTILDTLVCGYLKSQEIAEHVFPALNIPTTIAFFSMLSSCLFFLVICKSQSHLSVCRQTK
ncbi:hypothetical protein VP01_1111g10 [Puccinia sorghi]|uniref:Uncharacterized protein n=1 Tax=Puccinia sorghi TaxID=27349 RepID=A0A0L6VSM6_9BASI|nr:hypothetical protein VP01_1111g10 [Puccinia sorghi]